MSGVLVVAEHRQGVVRDVTFELISAAAALKANGAGPISVAVVGARAADLAPEVSSQAVDEIVALPTGAEHYDPHLTEAALGALIDEMGPRAVLVGHTVDGFGFAPALASERRLGFASNVLSVEWMGGELGARRAVYGDRLIAELAFDKPTVVLMLRSGGYAPAEVGGTATVREFDGDFGQPMVRHRGFREADRGDVDITASEFLLSIGRGIGEEENVERFAQLAEKLGATLSSSRPLVDAGWMPSSRQVGQSGRTVAPKVYLALGISGAVQHLAGIRDAETVIAVNTDPEAPIFAVARYGAVVDVHELADALVALL